MTCTVLTYRGAYPVAYVARAASSPAKAERLLTLLQRIQPQLSHKVQS